MPSSPVTLTRRRGGVETSSPDHNYRGQSPTKWQQKTIGRDLDSWQGTLARLARTRRALERIGAEEKARGVGSVEEKIDSCERDAIIFRNLDDDTLIVTRPRCRHRLCPHCARFRAIDIKQKALMHVREMDHPVFITLTRKHDDLPLKEQIADLVGSFRNLRRDERWNKRVAGGLYVIEVTRNEKDGQWHPHLHVLCDSKWWPYDLLKNAWKQASNGSTIVDIEEPRSQNHVCTYVCKYISKTNTPVTQNPFATAEWIEAIRSLRMVNTFGNAHGRTLAREEPEPRAEVERICPLKVLEYDAVTSLEARSILEYLVDLPGPEAATWHREVKAKLLRYLATRTRAGPHAREDAPATAVKINNQCALNFGPHRPPSALVGGL